MVATTSSHKMVVVVVLVVVVLTRLLLELHSQSHRRCKVLQVVTVHQHHRLIPLLVVVTNNQALGAEYYKLEVKKMNVETSQIPTPDLGALGVAMGGKGALVKNIDQLRAAVNEWVAKPCPMVIDMRISRTVMSIPYRRLHYGKDE